MAGKRLLYYGLQRSGTNYLAHLLEQQLDVELLNKRYDRKHPRHKHFRIFDNKEIICRENYRNELFIKELQDFESKLEIEGEADGFIIISKDPYSWLISYKKWAKRMKWPEPAYPYVMEYNAFYRKWLELSSGNEKVIFLRYTDLLLDPQESLKLISLKFKLDRLDLASPENVQISKVPYSSKFTKKKLAYYSKQKYLRKYSKKALLELNGLIDHDLIKKLGYKSYF